MLSCLFLIPPELIHVLERESGIGKPVTLLDDLCIEEGAILQEQVGEAPSEGQNFRGSTLRRNQANLGN